MNFIGTFISGNVTDDVKCIMNTTMKTNYLAQEGDVMYDERESKLYCYNGIFWINMNSDIHMAKCVEMSKELSGKTFQEIVEHIVTNYTKR